MKYKEVWNDGKNQFTQYVDTRSNNVNSNGENVVAINLKLFHFFFLKIDEIEFKMKLQSFFVWSFSKCLQNLSFHVFYLDCTSEQEVFRGGDEASS